MTQELTKRLEKQHFIINYITIQKKENPEFPLGFSMIVVGLQPFRQFCAKDLEFIVIKH